MACPEKSSKKILALSLRYNGIASVITSIVAALLAWVISFLDVLPPMFVIDAVDFSAGPESDGATEVVLVAVSHWSTLCEFDVLPVTLFLWPPGRTMLLEFSAVS